MCVRVCVCVCVCVFLLMYFCHCQASIDLDLERQDIMGFMLVLFCESETVSGGLAAHCENVSKVSKMLFKVILKMHPGRPILTRSMFHVCCDVISLFVRLLHEQCRAVGLQLACRPLSELHVGMATAPAGLTGVRT